MFVDERGQQAEVLAHGEQEERHGEQQADDQQAALGVDLVLAGGRFGILRVPAQLQGLEAGRSHHAADLRLADDRRHVFHAGFLGRVGHLGFEHAFLLAQGVFQAPRIAVVGQALDHQVGLAGGDAVADILDARHQLG